MPDQLTPAERAAIAAYTGPVQIIPRGVSGLPPVDYGKGIDWRVQIKARYAECKATMPAVKPGPLSGEQRSAMMRAAKAERREAIRQTLPPMRVIKGETRAQTSARLIVEGRSTREIGDFLGVTGPAVWQMARRYNATQNELNTTQGA